MPFSEMMVAPVRQEVRRLGLRELRTPEEVDEALRAEETTMVVVNSMCGCAGGILRPALAEALRHPVRPQALTTVFAGQDVDATVRAREYFVPHPPSSPSVALLRGGDLLYFLPREAIQGRTAAAVAAELVQAFEAQLESET